MLVLVHRAEQARRPGSTGSHVHVLFARQPALAGTEGKHTCVSISCLYDLGVVYVHIHLLYKNTMINEGVC